VAGCCECGDEPSGSGATELVSYYSVCVGEDEKDIFGPLISRRYYPVIRLEKSGKMAKSLRITGSWVEAEKGHRYEAGEWPLGRSFSRVLRPCIVTSPRSLQPVHLNQRR
jgi:hypothetical protein